MTGNTWEANTPRPGPDCARFADWLPLLTLPTPPAGVAGVNGRGAADAAMDLDAVRAHAQQCAYCQWQLATYTATDRALRTEYAIPTGVAPFLSLDAIVQRVALEAAGGTSGDVSGDVSGWAADTTHDESTDDIYHEIEVDMTPYSEQERQAPASSQAPVSLRAAVAPSTRPRSRSRRFIPALTGLVAAAVIVALFSALFYTFGANHRRTAQTAHTTHYLGANGHWQIISQFADSTAQGAFAAQSNPQVIYVVTNSSSLRRTDDGGQTWVTLQLPTQDFPAAATIQGVEVQVSPLNPQIVLLTLVSNASNPNCPASNLGPGTLHPPTASASTTSQQLSASIVPTSGGYSCNFQYVSSNGGATWSKLSLVDNVKLRIAALANTLQVGGRHLFAFAQPDANGQETGVGRLMGSADGGLTWAPVDGAIAASGQGVIQFVASPTGAALFAMTISRSQTGGDGGGYTPTLWRSDDAGASWTNEGPFNQPPPQPNVTGEYYYLLTATTANGQTLLYELRPGYTPQPTPTAIPGTSAFAPGAPNSITPGDIFVSADSGHTWSEASQLGVPAGLYAGQFSSKGIAGTLSDGQIAMLFYKSIAHISHVTANGFQESFSMSDPAYYAWSPGAQSWQQLTPTFDGSMFSQQWIVPASASQPQTIWQLVRTGNTYTVERCPLA
ncbi:MAG: sialidase family protein [Ktedonobacterales bacterium]